MQYVLRSHPALFHLTARQDPNQGRYDEAEAECRDVLAARTRLLGAEHPDTLNTRRNLSLLTPHQG
jgi:hypothetical protein